MVGNHIFQAERRSIHYNNKQIANSKINFKIGSIRKPIVIDGYEKSGKILQGLPGIANISKIDWLQDIPQYPALRTLSDRISRVVDFLNMDLLHIFFYSIALVGILAVVSCLMPIITIIFFILRLACKPLRSLSTMTSHFQWMHSDGSTSNMYSMQQLAKRTNTKKNKYDNLDKIRIL